MFSKPKRGGLTGKKKTYFQYSRHVTGALTPEKLDFYRLHPEFVKGRFPILDMNWFQDVSTGFALDTNIFRWLENTVRNSFTLGPMETRQSWETTWRVVKESIDIQGEHLVKGLSKSNLSTKTAVLNLLSADPRMERAGMDKQNILKIHRDLTRKAEEGLPSFRIDILPHFEFYGDLVILHNFPGHPLVITYQMLVGVLDKIESYFSCLLYVLYMAQTENRRDYDTINLFDSVYKFLDEVYNSEGNQATILFKSLEPISVGVTLRMFPAESNDHEFLDHLVAGLAEKNPALEKYAIQLIKLYQDYLKIHGEAGIPFVMEQFGQEKLHFYPVISIEGGLKKMHKHGTSYRPITDQAARNIASNFKREYFVAYYEKNKVLPKTYEHIGVDRDLKRIIKAGRPGSIRECYKIPNQAWEKLTFLKNHDFNYFPQISDLLDDKAITPPKSCLNQLFAEDALKFMGLKRPKEPRNTRLILEILDREHISIKDYFDQVENQGFIPDEWLVIQLMSKEKELKIDARQFSILTFECRMMASSCERNLGEQILPLFKMQSMTLSGSALRQKMDILSTLPETDESIWIRFHMDLEQWNYTFRSEQQSYITGVLCDLFGVNHYRYLTQIFTSSLLFSSNKFTPPGMEGVFSSWTDHAGGNQGILQKLWTLITIVVIRAVMHKLDVEHRLTGSGDNQVLFVNLKKGEGLQRMIQTIKTELAQAFKDVGLALKMEETWQSGVLTAYQRKYYLRGVLLSAGIKLSARAFSGESDINCGLNSIVTTAINGGVGLTEQNSDPLIGIVFSYVEIFMNIIGHPDFKTKSTHTYESYVMLSFLSSDFGFLPFQQLTGFLYAGHQDTLTESFSLLRFIWDHHHKYRGHISSIFNFKSGDLSDETLLQLILEPTALNISRPRLPEAIIRSRVEEYLTASENVRNKQLANMFANCQKEDQLQMARELAKIRPINAALLHSLFEYSHIGSLLGTLSRFNRISSIIKSMGLNQCGDESVCFSAQVRDLDIRNFSYFMDRIRPSVSVQGSFFRAAIKIGWEKYLNYCQINKLQTECTFSLRLYLIALTYGLGNELVTGPYTPSPAEQLTIFEDPEHPIGGSSLIINPGYQIPDTSGKLELQRGPYHLYIGNRTADPVRSIKLTSLDGVEAGTAIKIILKILAWMKSTHSDQNVIKFVESELGIRMEGLGSIIPGLVPGTAGGNIDHRFGSPGTVMWAFANSTSLISTWYQITSNQARDLQRGEEDRFVFFQQLFHHIYSVLRFCNPYKSRIIADINLDHCSYLIPKSQFKSPPLFLPGKEKLITGIVLDEERKAALAAEAEHYTSVMTKSLVHTCDPKLLLSACIGLEVANSIVSFDLGIDLGGSEDHRTDGSQTTINLSILRQLSIKDLLVSLAVHLSYQGYFGNKITPISLIRKLDQRSQVGLAGISTTPLINILQALATSGLIPQLLAMSGDYWDWKGDTSLKTLIGPLFKGMSISLRNWKDKGLVTLLLVEVKGSNYPYHKLLRFLKHWNKNISKILDYNKDHSVTNQLEVVNEISHSLKIVLTTDVGIATESGRRRNTEGAQSDIVSEDGLSSATNRLQVYQPGSPPWISATVFNANSAHDRDSELILLKKVLSQWTTKNKVLTNFMRWNHGHSRGALKLIEIIARSSLTFQQHGLAVCLGEGVASFLSTLLHYHPSLKGIYNSLIIPEKIPPAMAGIYSPPALYCPCLLTSRVLNLPFESAFCGDLTLPFVWQELDNIIGRQGQAIEVLTLDIPYIEKKSALILEKLLEAVTAWKPQSIIVKVTLEELIEGSTQTIAYLADCYFNQEWIKPLYSNIYSSEVYLVCKVWKGVPEIPPDIDIYSLIHQFELLPGLTDNKLIGERVLDAFLIGGKINVCPSWITAKDRDQIELQGGILFLLEPLFSHYYNLVLRRLQRTQKLSRSEQIVTKSLSSQSQHSVMEVNSVLLVIAFYIQNRGILPMINGNKLVQKNLGIDITPLFTLSELAKSVNPSWSLVDRVIDLYALVVFFDDRWEQEFTAKLVFSMCQFFALHDDFGLLTPKVQELLKSVINLNRLTIQDGLYNWVEDLNDPKRFIIINKLLEAIIEERVWDKCLVTTEVELLKPWIEGLPWSPTLKTSDTHELRIVTSLFGKRPVYTSGRWIIPIIIVRVGASKNISYRDQRELGVTMREGKNYGVFTSR